MSKTCQSCKQAFTIESDDLGFYEQMHAPPPTWCSRCRLIRRLAWVAYTVLYRRKCDFSGEEVISSFHESVPFKVYGQDIWWSDKWDPKEYGRDYDFDRPFFEQWGELLRDVPMPSLTTEYTTLVNSEYCNAVATLKNCYLCFGFDESEDCMYCRIGAGMKHCLDSAFSNYNELTYDVLNSTKCFQCFYSQDIEECHGVWFSRDLVGCSDCLGCINLRNKSYHIFNKPYSKEEYEKILKEYDFGSRENVKAFREKAETFFLEHPRREFHGYNNHDVSGEYIYHSKNVKDSYMVRNSENLRYCHMLKNGFVNNAMDYTVFGMKADWLYEASWVGIQTNMVKFSAWAYRNHDIEYCFGCHSSENLFGCVGLRHAKYCIFNKQYSKSDYVDLVGRIKTQMQEVPYKDSLGREFRYGEFFPQEFCPWTYNESNAQDFFPLDQDAARKQGLTWREPDAREYQDATAEVPDHIKDVKDGILGAILKCRTCGKNYRFVSQELAFYRRYNIAPPEACPACRERERIGRLNPISLYSRSCKKCGKDIKTPYSTKGREIVYCEECYQGEVV